MPRLIDADAFIAREIKQCHCWDEYRAAYCDSCGARMDGAE